MTSEGRRGVADFYIHHFSVSRHCDGGAYLLSVAVLRSPPQKEGSYQFIFPEGERFGGPADAPGATGLLMQMTNH